MGELLTTGSILAAFFAGAVALFSPCCIVFLFPAYLASAVKGRRWRALPLTLVFGAGIAVVLLPITIGVGMVATALARFHTPLYLVGGVLMLGLAALALTGRSWRMPSFVRSPAVEATDAPGVFALGVFSGVASSCCAPVLAGVMTLSALSSSVAGSASLGLAYVFGMVFPLVLMALLWDRLRLGERRLFAARAIRLRFGGRTLHTNTVNVGVAIAFAVMGTVVLGLAVTGNERIAPPMQVTAGRWLSGALRRVVAFLDPVPEPILGITLVALAAVIFITAFRRPHLDTEGVSHDHGDEDGIHGSGGEGPPSSDATATPLGASRSPTSSTSCH